MRPASEAQPSPPPQLAPQTVGAPAASTHRLAAFAWGVLAYNLLVIAWGAFVRASGSGAGCGRHWPLCNGELVPRTDSIKTVIEASHRGTVIIAMVGVVVLMVWTFRVLPRGHRARPASVAGTVLILSEALIGAGLVLFELVANDKSLKRGVSMILHLDNTFLLLAALSITAWAITTEDAGSPTASNPDDSPARSPRAQVRSRGLLRAVVGLALASLLVLGSSGAIAALGDTLFPPASLREGMAQDFSPLAHLFLRLRLLHPFIALATGVMVFVSASVVRVMRPEPRVRLFARIVTLVFVAQFAVGLLNMTLLAPVPMQLLHLLMADATWIALVLMGWEVVYPKQRRRALVTSPTPASRTAQSPIMSRNGPAPMSDVPPSTSSVDPVT